MSDLAIQSEGQQIRGQEILRFAPAPATKLTIFCANGTEAVIDFSTDTVRYSGECPVEQAAKKLFDALDYLTGQQMFPDTGCYRAKKADPWMLVYEGKATGDRCPPGLLRLLQENKKGRTP